MCACTECFFVSLWSYTCIVNVCVHVCIICVWLNPWFLSTRLTRLNSPRSVIWFVCLWSLLRPPPCFPIPSHWEPYEAKFSLPHTAHDALLKDPLSCTNLSIRDKEIIFHGPCPIFVLFGRPGDTWEMGSQTATDGGWFFRASEIFTRHNCRRCMLIVYNGFPFTDHGRLDTYRPHRIRPIPQPRGNDIS